MALDEAAQSRKLPTSITVDHGAEFNSLVMLTYSPSPDILAGELLRHRKIGTQLTLHGRFQRLHQMRYVHLEPLPDGKKKKVVPTEQASSALQQVS